MKKAVRGKGLLNKLIDRLPIEIHLPKYNYCGPGTKLSKRLARQDPGINHLDTACKAHDIAYSKFSDLTQRHEADRILQQEAERLQSARGSSFGERLAAFGVGSAMAAKRKLGMGVRRTRKRRIPIAKRGGVILPIAATAAYALTAANALKNLLSSSKKGKVLYLDPYKRRGDGLRRNKKNSGKGLKRRRRRKKKKKNNFL